MSTVTRQGSFDKHYLDNSSVYTTLIYQPGPSFLNQTHGFHSLSTIPYCHSVNYLIPLIASSYRADFSKDFKSSANLLSNSVQYLLDPLIRTPCSRLDRKHRDALVILGCNVEKSKPEHFQYRFPPRHRLRCILVLI
jgi:hypothetical protein